MIILGRKLLIPDEEKSLKGIVFMTLKKVSSREAVHGEVSSFRMRFSSNIIEYTLNAGGWKQMC